MHKSTYTSQYMYFHQRIACLPQCSGQNKRNSQQTNFFLIFSVYMFKCELKSAHSYIRIQYHRYQSVAVLTRGALSREHAYATIAYLKQIHHYFGTYKICSPSYQDYALSINKKSLFQRISYFRPLPLGPCRPRRASTLLSNDSPFHSVNFKPKYNSLCQLEAEI